MAEEQKIGRYTIKGKLGKGSMALVLHAYDPRFERDVALKVLHRKFANNKIVRQRFIQEARTIAKLDHPAIVPIYDAAQDGDYTYLVMRLMEQDSLLDRITNSDSLPVDDIISLVTRVGSALDAAHAADIVHRDVKPDNIMFDRYGAAYLADFGIVKIADSDVQMTTDTLVGTPAYMSPEQVNGTTGVDGRSDIYSLGAVLYEMLTGRLPYHAETALRMAMQHVTQPVPRLQTHAPELSKKWQGVVSKAMAKNPEARYQTGQEFSNAVAQMGQSVGTPVLSRKQRRLAPIALFLLLIPLFLGWGIYSRRQQTQNIANARVQVSLNQTATIVQENELSEQSTADAIQSNIQATELAVAMLETGTAIAVEIMGDAADQSTSMETAVAQTLEALLPTATSTVLPTSLPQSTEVPQATETPILSPSPSPLPTQTETPDETPIAGPTPQPTATDIPATPTATLNWNATQTVVAEQTKSAWSGTATVVALQTKGATEAEQAAQAASFKGTATASASQTRSAWSATSTRSAAQTIEASQAIQTRQAQSFNATQTRQAAAQLAAATQTRQASSATQTRQAAQSLAAATQTRQAISATQTRQAAQSLAAATQTRQAIMATQTREQAQANYNATLTVQAVPTSAPPTATSILATPVPAALPTATQAVSGGSAGSGGSTSATSCGANEAFVKARVRWGAIPQPGATLQLVAFQGSASTNYTTDSAGIAGFCYGDLGRWRLNGIANTQFGTATTQIFSPGNLPVIDLKAGGVVNIDVQVALSNSFAWTTPSQGSTLNGSIVDVAWQSPGYPNIGSYYFVWIDNINPHLYNGDRVVAGTETSAQLNTGIPNFEKNRICFKIQVIVYDTSGIAIGFAGNLNNERFCVQQ